MKKSFLLLTLFSVALAGCGQVSDSGSDVLTATPAVVEKIQVVASFYPLAFMAEQITGDKAVVKNLAGAVDIHEYEPTPQDLVHLNQADLVVFQGADLEPWADGVVTNLQEKGITTLEVSDDLDLAKITEPDEHEDQHEDEHEEEEADHHDEHDHGEFDPHTWLDPVLAQGMVAKILKTLIEIDPVNASVYSLNAQVLQQKFVALDAAFTAGLAQCANDELIVSHDAYGYLAQRYDFRAHTISGVFSQNEPSAKIMAELKAEAEAGVTHILVEENGVRAFAETLASETGLTTLPINPLGRGTLNPDKDFFAVMEANLSSLKAALNCQ